MSRLLCFIPALFVCLYIHAQTDNGNDAQWPQPVDISKDIVKKPVLGKNQIRIATYSILPEQTPRENPLERWHSRIRQIKHILQDCNIDVAGTQRALHWQASQLAERSGYAIVGDEPDSLKPASSSQAILYNKQRAKLMNWGQFLFAGNTKRNEETRHGCTWACFKLTNGKKEFYVFNTLLRNKEEAGELMANAKKIAGTKPVVFTADLGGQMYKPAPKAIKDSGMQDTYLIPMLRLGKFGTFHNFQTLNPIQRFDYIYVSKHFIVNEYDAVDEELQTIRPGSDHLPVVVDLAFGKQEH